MQKGESMKKTGDFKKGKAYLGSLCLAMALLLPGSTAGAADQLLPSGIAYEDLNTEIENYIQEHEQTTVGLAYSVFDASQDIARGYYGYADKENGIAVDEDTVFEWGSGSKVIAWVCVMQMYEQGKLDLDADIREYLPDGFLTNLNYDQPVTMINLMNHNAGFQDQSVDVNMVQGGYLTTLEEAVSAHKPEQIFEPGILTGYSNWGTALAAYIVERLSGMQYYEYVHKNIFEPLGMEHSAICQDLSDNEWVQEQRQKLRCYSPEGAWLMNTYFYITLYPAGMCNSTFSDYETFAKAMLTRSDKLLKAETWETMYTPTDYFGDTEMAKNYHGLWGVYYAVPTVGHIGRTSGCSSYLMLDLQDGIGSVVMSNQGNESVYTENILPLFYGEYDATAYQAGVEKPEGTYRNAKTVGKGPFKLTALLAGFDKDLSREYWTLTEDSARPAVELAYMDYFRVPAFQTLTETGLLALFAAGLVFALLSFLVGLVLIRREKKRRPLSLWSFFTGFLPFAVPLLYLRIMSAVYLPVNTYLWMFIAIGVIALLLVGLLAFGVVRNIRGDYSKGVRIYNWVVIFFGVMAVVNICYWNLFMSWEV